MMEYTERQNRQVPEETLDQMEAGLYRALSEAEDPEAIYQIRTSLQRIDVLRRQFRRTALRAE